MKKKRGKQRTRKKERTTANKEPLTHLQHSEKEERRGREEDSAVWTGISGKLAK